MSDLMAPKGLKTLEGGPIAVLLYMGDRWYFMGEETHDPAIVLGCILAAPAFREWGERLKDE
jgi:hypothetical protein